MFDPKKGIAEFSETLFLEATLYYEEKKKKF